MQAFFEKCTLWYLSFILIFSFTQISAPAFSQCSATVALTVPNSYFGPGFVGNGNFNAIIFGDLNALGGDTEGRLAVGGNFNAPNSYSVGSAPEGRSTTPGTDNLIVNGNFTNRNNWGMIGNFIYNTLNAGSQLPTHPAGTGVNTGGITGRLSFTNLKTYYENLSATLDAKTTTGTVVYNVYGNYVEILLKGTDAATNVFSLTIPDGKTFDLKFQNIPVTSEVLINVTNKIVGINGGSITTGATYRAKTVFNFPKATSISLASYALEGAVLAPFANLTGSGGNINGQTIIGGHVEQTNGFEFHNFCSAFLPPSTTPLPVTLTSFTVSNEGNQAVLNWETTLETNSDRFEIQHSTDAKQWNFVGTVVSKGESKELAHYQFVHSNPVNGKNYYRLKMTDLDGTYAFSRVRDVSVNGVAALAVYPNPVINQATIATQDWNNVKEIYLINAAGKRMALSASSDKIDLSQVGAGIYVLQVNQLNGATSTAKIVKQ
ncbi:choice-of-anchor A family protein [Dyadobacter sp. LHD-138]|uniref:choice-of-anchor A family protein n=1 Tax=Dyadobacter sp. LHD-138 TaxID=3071413 RepID=UPI0027E21020|nr:choice-of-anchor A family protein [Dyadobacter sp. LHD-138]MDQ6478061.1 choice-of-anchor A family protein [Dyadobacter sp. LHD-138]